MQHSTWHSETWHLATRGPRKCVEVPQFCTQRKHEKKVYRVSKCNKYSHILEYMSVTITARYSSKIRTKTSSVAYACSCWIPKATNIHYSLLFHCNNGCTNAPQCYVIRTLPVLFVSSSKVCPLTPLSYVKYRFLGRTEKLRTLC